jgi:hypothetical protein
MFVEHIRALGFELVRHFEHRCRVSKPRQRIVHTADSLVRVGYPTSIVGVDELENRMNFLEPSARLLYRVIAGTSAVLKLGFRGTDLPSVH